MNSTIEYKRFRAKVEYSPEDEVFVGHALGLSPSHILSFHGSSTMELKSAFKDSIDLHIELCKKKKESKPILQ